MERIIEEKTVDLFESLTVCYVRINVLTVCAYAMGAGMQCSAEAAS